MTTYYPSPFGAYQKLTVYDSVGIGTTTVEIGTTTPGAKLEVDETSTGSIRGMINTQYSDDALGGLMTYRKARGTAQSPFKVLRGDDLGINIFGGYDGDSFGEGAWIEAQASEDWSINSHGTHLIFWTTHKGSATAVPMVLINEAGNVGIGIAKGQTDLYPGARLDVSGSVNIEGLVRIAGGNPARGKVLTSDDNGVGSWQLGGGPIKIGAIWDETKAADSGDYYSQTGCTGQVFSGGGIVNYNKITDPTGIMIK